MSGPWQWLSGLWQWLTGLLPLVLGLVILLGAILGALGAILSAGGGFLALLRQSRMSEGIRTQVEANLKRTEENLGQTREAVTRIEDAIGHLTGGDSYCYFLPIELDRATNKLSFAVPAKSPGKDKAKYPLHDVTAQIIDRDKQEKGGTPSSLEEWRSRQTTVRLGTLSPGFANAAPAWPFEPRDTHRYLIHFYTKYSTFTQNLIIRVVAGRWAVASRVVRDGEVIQGSESIPKDFLRDEQGQVQW